MRRHLREWWQAILLTRIEPRRSVIVIRTRWDEDDLAGRIYVLDDRSGTLGAETWRAETFPLAIELRADAIGIGIGIESNFEGDMSRQIVQQTWQELQREGRTEGISLSQGVAGALRTARTAPSPLDEVHPEGGGQR
ncbi:hypothetical protein B7P34_02200 [Streptosporangium nondiastaticum]|uniref:Uncharacterized protein n=1 Tax=Streptosporangium nondiastaticum TaxID=35764 RepID=A0A9X7JV41_9ACTN|nr:hypothetical protein [Streptosporangium nondiastaticum]PSJ30392.1 hypothetical protein B7P34_02200 [Streptosporangium nondiastaticum]